MIFDFTSVGSWTIIYSSPKSLIYRAYRKLDRQPVIIKVINNIQPDDRQLILLRDRYTTIDNLNLNGVIQLYSLECYRDRYTLVMEDGGISLLEYSKSQPLAIEQFLQIAIKIAEILAGLYQKQVIHKDIKPGHILINPETQQIKLIDFSIASLLPRETQTIKNPNLLEGTLAYLSPEQTGRMNRGIDYRTDFYSLGVTFYQLLTGQLPFQSNDSIELVHCHLAKIPLPVDRVNPQIPIALSNIVSKLMAKNAEDRYQNALGLKYDLQQCLTQWQTTGNITEFAIAKRDKRGRFLIPEKLYGRENEVQTLLNAFERVASGNSELILVAGYSGIGKTAIVNKIHKPIVRQRGYFIQGKFDQFNRHVPLSALLQAFRGLIRQILGETDKQLEQWKSLILNALENNGRVIVEVIPELEKIIGVQPNPIPLDGDAAQNRFKLLFEKFIEVFAQKEHPLVIFLDDLQWADSASLNLIKLSIENNNQGYLLLIGAYRDNEVDYAHPLMLTIAEIEKTRAIVNKINLAPLTELQVNRLVADSLNCSEEIAFPLTHLVYRKTQGNPFFTDRFLQTLHEDELITFNFDLGLWKWNLNEIEGLTITDDVVEFVMIQLQKLPQTSQEILKIAACLGNQFDLKILAIAAKKTETEITEHLWQLVEEGLILLKSDNYQYFQDRDLETNNLELDIAENTVNSRSYKFLHDRIQQAAYSLLPEEEKPATHYHIGNLLLNHFSETELEVHIFEIVSHLNRGLSLIKATDEREKLIQLNLMAARKAKTAIAYGAAVNYYTTAIDLLVIDAWKTNYELTLTLHNERLESACLNKDYEKLSDWGDIVLQNAISILDTIPVYESFIIKTRSQGNFVLAIATGLQVLKLLGVEFPQQPTSEDIAEAAAKTRQLWQGKSPLSLLNLPSMNDSHQIAMMQIMTSLSASAFMANPPLLLLLVFKQVELSIENGNCPISIFAYADYGLILCGMFQDIDGGYEFGRLALSLLEQYQIKPFKSRVYFIVNAFIRHWKEPLHKCIPFLLEGYQSGLETGTWESVAMNLITYSVYKYYGGRELKELSKEINNYGKFIRQIKEKATLKQHEVLQQTILNLLGEAEVPYYLNGTIFNAKQTIPLLQATNNQMALSYAYLSQAILYYLFGQDEEAWQQLILLDRHTNTLASHFTATEESFYDALIHLARYSKVSCDKQPEILQRVNLQQEKLKFWASYAPFNHQHKWELVAAEQYRVLGQRLEAIDYYDRAIASAKDNGFLREEALANELAAKFYLNWGKEKIAKVYLQEAYNCYLRWGAKAKTDDLIECYPQLLDSLPQLNNLSTEKSNIQETTCQNLDFMTIFQASQALSREIHLDKLLVTLLKAIFANAGANKGVLILVQKDNLTIEAIAAAEKEPEVLLGLPIDESSAIPHSLIYQVKRTQETIVIADARQETSLATDDYFIEQQTESVLCTPILQQGKLLGILYLENNLTIGAFSSDRVEIINLLCTQAAISLENARLYQQSQTYAQQLEQSLEKLKTSQARFERLADNVPGVIYQFKILATGEWKMAYFSPGATEMFEVSPEEVMADVAVIVKMVHPEDKAEFERSIALSAETLNPWEWNGRFVLPSGQIKWIQGKSRPEQQPNGDLLWDGLLFDISEAKHREAERKQAEEILRQYEKIVNTTEDCMVLLDRNYNHKIANQSAAQHCGLSPLEIIGRSLREFCLPEVFEKFFKPNIDLCFTGKTISQEIWSPIVREGETSRFLSISFCPYLESNQTISGVVIIARDITERKQAEDSLKQQLAAIEASIDGIGILKCGIYTYLNKSHLTTFGYDRSEELIGQNWQQLYSPEEIERFESEIFPLLERDRYWTGEAIATKKDGTTFPEELSLTLIDENYLICVCRDISDRKRLEAQQQRLLDVLEATPDYIGIASNKGEIVWHNKQMRELRQDLTIHKHISECHPAWVNEIILNRALPTAIEFGSWSGEVTLLDENGREIPVSQVIIAHKSKSGAVEYFSTIMRDITERKQYEQQLQELSERLELAIQSAQIGIWEWDYLSNRLSWDDRMFAIYGIQAEDFRHTHQDWEKYVHPDDLADAQKDLLDTGNHFTKEFRIIRNDGTIRYIFSTATIQYDERGQFIRAVGVNIDISDRKQTELALAEQQAELLALFDAMQDVIVVLDADGQYLKVAPTGTHLLYKPAPDLVGKTLAEVLPSETASYFLSEIDKVLANKELRRIEYSLTIVDREIWFEASIVPLTDTSVVWFARDISDRKQAEQLLEEYNQTLEREVAERTEQLSQTLEELKLTQDQLIESKKMAALGTLVAGVAHEVNTPVGTSITVASTLADRTTTLIAQVERGELKRSDLDKYLNLTCECNQIILTNLHRAADLVQTFKQVAVDTNDLECRSIFLIAYLQEIVFSLTPNFRPLGHKITITGDDKLEIVTHPGSLAQAIANLSLNSIEHAYDDENFGHLKFEVLQQKESVIIEYSDDGCGISPENLKHIFEPFFTTARNRGGTGLGLHIVYNLITQKLQGKIEVESQVDRGTKFRLTLPLKLFDT